MKSTELIRSNSIKSKLFIARGKGRLSIREKRVLTLAAQGLDNPDIAKILYISPHTVKAHLKKVFRKLEAPNRTNAVYRAMKNHIID